MMHPAIGFLIGAVSASGGVGLALMAAGPDEPATQYCENVIEYVGPDAEFKDRHFINTWQRCEGTERGAGWHCSCLVGEPTDTYSYTRVVPEDRS